MATQFTPADSPAAKPSPGWSRRMPRDERIFLWLLALSVAAMTAFTIAWVAGLGDENAPDTSVVVTPDEFRAQVGAFVEKYQGEDGRVVVPPGVDAYLLAQRYAFFPELVLKPGQKYTINISSTDVLHGWSLVGGGQNLNIEVAPNHVFKLKLTPEEPGTYLIVCNEYCGLGHHQMRGRIIVEE
jgi:cytochrome c oxidase subunit 2